MSFYESIAEYYHHIFPLNKTQASFVQESFDETQQKDLLDIGCGIGELSSELSKSFKSVHAIDLDEAMIQKALSGNQTANLHFQKLNMLEIERTFGADAIDAIVCFGNTLVHLDGPEQLLDFFKQSKATLKNDGKLLLQIINYDRIIDQNIKALPTIENDYIRFVRNYDLHQGQKMLDFHTILTIKKSGHIIENKIQLYPVRSSEIKHLLMQAGFINFEFYGNFKQEKFTKNSIPLVVNTN